MKFWKTFDIEVIKYKEGLHEVDFPIGDAFFQQVEGNDLLDKGNLTAWVKVDKAKKEIKVKGGATYAPTQSHFDLMSVLQFYKR